MATRRLSLRRGGGSTTLSVTLVNSSGELITDSVDVSFNSDCIASGRSVLSGAGEAGGNSVSTNNGRAEVTYTANGCTGNDQITARASHEGVSTGSARTTIEVESDTIQTLTFIGADPELIGLKGTGTQKTSKVTFQVLGSTGTPMGDVEVNFALSPREREACHWSTQQAPATPAAGPSIHTALSMKTLKLMALASARSLGAVKAPPKALGRL